MIEQGDSAKPIWFTEFGFSSVNGWNGAGLQGQADHLERAIDIIRTQWPFVQVACVHEFIDNRLIKHREGYFGLLDKQLRIKPSGLVFIKKLKNYSSIISTTPPTIIESIIFPYDSIQTNTPYFSWPSIPYVCGYCLWVNDYGQTPDVGGRINNCYSPSEANCPLSNGQYCKVTPNVQFSRPGGGQWWLTTHFSTNRTSHKIIDGFLFDIQ
jgi:hypothetical protein